MQAGGDAQDLGTNVEQNLGNPSRCCEGSWTSSRDADATGRAIVVAVMTSPNNVTLTFAGQATPKDTLLDGLLCRRFFIKIGTHACGNYLYARHVCRRQAETVGGLKSAWIMVLVFVVFSKFGSSFAGACSTGTRVAPMPLSSAPVSLEALTCMLICPVSIPH